MKKTSKNNIVLQFILLIIFLILIVYIVNCYLVAKKIEETLSTKYKAEMNMLGSAHYSILAECYMQEATPKDKFLPFTIYYDTGRDYWVDNYLEKLFASKVSEGIEAFLNENYKKYAEINIDFCFTESINWVNKNITDETEYEQVLANGKGYYECTFFIDKHISQLSDNDFIIIEEIINYIKSEKYLPDKIWIYTKRINDKVGIKKIIDFDKDEVLAFNSINDYRNIILKNIEALNN